jgi:hypothetical protein
MTDWVVWSEEHGACKKCNGRDPVDMIWCVQFGHASGDSREFVPYDGPLPDSDAYKARQAQFDGVLANGGGHS